MINYQCQYKIQVQVLVVRLLVHNINLIYREHISQYEGIEYVLVSQYVCPVEPDQNEVLD